MPLAPDQDETGQFTPISLHGLDLRYLIGADNPGNGSDGTLTVAGYDSRYKPAKGIAGKYVNLFDENNLGIYGPYMTSSGTARQYNEGQCDPRQQGFWNNLTMQLIRAKGEGYLLLGDIDNRDAYRNEHVLEVYSLARKWGLSVICKNPGMSDYNEYSPELLRHPAVAGAIIEKGAVTPQQIDQLRRAGGKPDLPVWFVSFGSGRSWCLDMVQQIKDRGYRNMGASNSPQGEYATSEILMTPVVGDPTNVPPKPVPSPEHPDVLDLGQKIRNLMFVKGYKWFPDQNVVSVEGMDPDGKKNANRNNAFDDIKMVIDGSGKIIGGPWEGTTAPGKYWTENPMAEGGAFIIAKGQQIGVWTPGEYHGKTVWRQAEGSHILGHRDPHATYKRSGPPVSHGNIGIHHHGGYDLPRGNISTAAAGCQVIRSTMSQANFMDMTMRNPDYLRDRKGFRLTATVFTADEVLS